MTTVRFSVKLYFMESRLTSTEVARRFGDILAEVKHAGTTIVVMKNGEPVAQLKPL